LTVAIVSVDSSGTFEEPPIWFVAVRKVNVQEHNALRLDEEQCSNYKRIIEKNWREKVSATSIFKSLRPLVKHFDIIQIDKDFLGWRKDYVERYLKTLFGKEFCGQYPLCEAKIQFIPKKYSPDIRLAHVKTRKARHKEIKSCDCPDLFELIQWLE